MIQVPYSSLVFGEIRKEELSETLRKLRTHITLLEELPDLEESRELEEINRIPIRQ